MEKFNFRKIVLSLFVVGVAFGLVGCGEDTQKQSVQRQNEEKKQSTSVKEIQKQPEDIILEKTDETVWYEIPELGIKTKVSKKMADEMDHVVSQEEKTGKVFWSKKEETTKSVEVYYKSIRKLKEDCSIFLVTRVKGDAIKSTNSYVTSRLQENIIVPLDEHFLFITGHQYDCLDGNEEAMQKRTEFFKNNPDVNMNDFKNNIQEIKN